MSITVDQPVTPDAANVHPWSLETHPAWCCRVGCGGIHRAAPDAVAIVDSDDEVLTAAQTGPDGDLVHMVFPDRFGPPQQVHFTPADALALAAALTAQARLFDTPAEWARRDVAAYLRDGDLVEVAA